MPSAKTRSRILLGLSILLALAFLMSGASKLANADSANKIPYGQQFIAWGYPAWFRFVVGSAEVLGAAGLFLTRTRFYAASGLTLVMLGAIMTHLRVGEYGYASFPVVLGILTATLGWMTRPDTLPFLPGRPSTEA